MLSYFKLRDKTLNHDEALELQKILEKEKALSLNDIMVLIAIGFFTTALVGFLADVDKKKEKKLFNF